MPAQDAIRQDTFYYASVDVWESMQIHAKSLQTTKNVEHQRVQCMLSLRKRLNK